MPLLGEKEINKIYNETKEDYLKTAITINKTDLDATIENADKKNEKIITDLINPMPGLFVDDQLNLENQFKYKSNDIERSFALTNQIQQRLDNVLEMMRKNNRQPAEIIMQKPIQQIPNTPLNNEKTNDIIKTEKIYILTIVTLMILTFFCLYLLTIEKILK